MRFGVRYYVTNTPRLWRWTLERRWQVVEQRPAQHDGRLVLEYTSISRHWSLARAHRRRDALNRKAGVAQ